VVHLTTILWQNGHIGLYSCQLHFSKYFYLGCIQSRRAALSKGGSVLSPLSGLSGLSALLWLAVAPVLVKMRGLATLSAPPNLISNPLSPLTFHRLSSQLSRPASSRQLPAHQLPAYSLAGNSLAGKVFSDNSQTLTISIYGIACNRVDTRISLSHWSR